MLRSVKELRGYRMLAKDGEIGSVYGFYFDDEAWTIRYMVADTGKWLPKRRILLSTSSLGKPDWEKREFPIDLTREKIENSPSIYEHEPVSRQKELELMDYYNWPAYSIGRQARTVGSEMMMQRDLKDANRGAEKQMVDEQQADRETEPNLRSSREVIGYKIDAADGKIGHVEDFIFDDESWEVRFLVIDTRDWLPGGKKVLISPKWIENINWLDALVSVDLEKEKIKNSPEFDPSQPVNEEYEQKLYDYYGRPRE